MIFNSGFEQMMHQVFGGFDMAIFSAFAFIQNDIFTAMAKFFCAVGEPSFSIMLFILGFVLLLFKRTRKIGILIICATGLFFIVNNLILKNVFYRLRPFNALQGNSAYFQWYLNAGAIPESESCFPSGHSCYSFTMATVLFLWIKNDLKKSEGWMLFIPAFIVACSRIYLMLHYPSDVLAGIIEGVALGCAVWYGWKLVDFLWHKFLPNFYEKFMQFDFEPKLEKKIGHKPAVNKVVALIVVVVICFWVTSFSGYTLKLAQSEKCCHTGPDYICMNEAHNKVYDDISGEWKYYCDLHK